MRLGLDLDSGLLVLYHSAGLPTLLDQQVTSNVDPPPHTLVFFQAAFLGRKFRNRVKLFKKSKKSNDFYASDFTGSLTI